MGQVFILPIKANSIHIQEQFRSAMSPLLHRDVIELIALPENEKRNAIHDVVLTITQSFSGRHPFLGAMQATAKEDLFEAFGEAEFDFEHNKDQNLIRQEWAQALNKVNEKLVDWALRKPITEAITPGLHVSH